MSGAAVHLHLMGLLGIAGGVLQQAYQLDCAACCWSQLVVRQRVVGAWCFRVLQGRHTVGHGLAMELFDIL